MVCDEDNIRKYFIFKIVYIISGFSQLRLNKKVELTLISRDADGLPISYGGLKIQSHVKYKDVNSKCLRMEVRY